MKKFNIFTSNWWRRDKQRSFHTLIRIENLYLSQKTVIFIQNYTLECNFTSEFPVWQHIPVTRHKMHKILASVKC